MATATAASTPGSARSALEPKGYPLQNVRMAFCSASMLANPRAAAAPFSPPYCRASAKTLWPWQVGHNQDTLTTLQCCDIKN